MEYKSKDLTKFLEKWLSESKLIPGLKYLGSPELRKICKPIKRLDKDTIGEINKLKRLLLKYRKNTKLGAGIAAPQVGNLKRFIVIFKDEKPMILINPQIIKKSKNSTIAEEWCMSMVTLTSKVIRPKFVTVEYMDENKHSQIWEADIFYSRLLQHEIDHLDGILCIDKAVKNGLRFVYNMDQFQGIKDYKK